MATSSTDRDPWRRRRIEIEVTVHDDDYEALCDALLAVADLMDRGQVDMCAGPAGDASGRPTKCPDCYEGWVAMPEGNARCCSCGGPGVGSDPAD